ncbi:methylated-DNA--[protein]-cysteine S-methyltransferase [candidate division WOR-3 bacterium]|nr:methylated-DNA--[protein]-cysteine S-methyltransferase [candidate division WOR-3 bacterium]
MEVYVFRSRGLRVGVRWGNGAAQEILLNPGEQAKNDRNLPGEIEKFFKELSRYLDGEKVRFSLPLDLDKLTPFARKVSEELAQTRVGEVITYSELARRVGRPKAARAVGRVMARNPFPLVIPCHRVVGSNGSLRGFSAGLALKKRLLEIEGCDHETP